MVACWGGRDGLYRYLELNLGACFRSRMAWREVLTFWEGLRVGWYVDSRKDG